MNPIQSYNVRIHRRPEIPPEVHNTRDARRLKEATQQFESILLAQVWKNMKANARVLGGNTGARPWGQMEDLAVEMASEELAVSGGVGLWRILYDQLIVNVAAGMKPEAGEDAADE